MLSTSLDINSLVSAITTLLYDVIVCDPGTFLKSIISLPDLTLISIVDPFDLETNISATAACFNNIGPGLAGVGPMSSYADYSVISKWTLSAGMLLGRLEILPIILLFAPGAWIRSNAKKG
jgi:trk system potassium uptake protein TrkH